MTKLIAASSSSSAASAIAKQSNRGETDSAFFLRRFHLALKIVGRIRLHFFVELRGRELFQPVPFLLQFVCRVEQQTSKRGRKQTGFHVEVRDLAHCFPISRQLRTVTQAKTFRFA